jgi:dihydrolipoamide dehydrogenase
MSSPLSDRQFDLVVIGAGPGGYIAAIRAAQLGMKVACVEKDATLGGTCLNVGCIPSKAMLESSERYAETRLGLKTHGIQVDGVRLDLATMLKRKSNVVRMLTKGVEGLFKKNAVTRISGTAAISGPGLVAVNGPDSGTLTCKNILIASGSKPVELPGLPLDGDRIVSSTEALEFSEVPSSLLVVGGGAIGLELGSVWARLGSDVTVVELMDQIVPGADEEAAKALQSTLEKQGLKFRLETTAGDARVTAEGVDVELACGDDRGRELFEKVLVAVGRCAFTEGLALDEAGVATDARGRIVVDGDYRTAVPGIYAIGDAIAGPMLAHKAEEEGVACVERMNGIAGHVNYDAIPNVVYTWPELASVGMTEKAARAGGRSIRTGRFPFRANARARCAGETDGFAKIVADEKTDRVLGIHVIGPHASELIAEAAVAMEFHAASEDIARSVHAHPTLSEVLKEAALAVDGRALNF